MSGLPATTCSLPTPWRGHRAGGAGLGGGVLRTRGTDLAGEGDEVVTHGGGALAELLDAGRVVLLPLRVLRAELGIGELGRLGVLDLAPRVLGGSAVAGAPGRLT